METFRMRKSEDRSAKPKKRDSPSTSGDGKRGWVRREWRLIALVAIMIVAFVLRFVFAYGVSAGSDFALSGGTGAASHTQIIQSMLNGSFSFTNPALNYPYGSVNVYPPLMDIVMAGIAGIVSLFGVSTGTAVAGTLAFAAPILGALTCWPVYLIGRKMFNDEKIGILAALLYAFFALLVMNTVFSNGTEYAFVGFLFAFMIYFLLKALECCDDVSGGFRAILRDRGVFKNTIIAGILFTMVVLSWNQFRVILLMLVFFMVAQAIVDRLRSKDVMPAVCIYSIVILIGMLISLPYYLVAGLWDLIFSGPFIVAILAVALSLFFGLTSKKTWVLMIPVTVIIAVVVLAVIYFVSGSLFSDIINGNSIYTNELMASIASSSRLTSISSMAAFFGWLTLWLPLMMFLYMFYKYRKNMDSKKYTFTMLWILAMFFIGWYSTSYAVIAGAGFAVASAALILLVVREADVKSYFMDMRGNGIRISPKKILKPVPLAVVIVLVALIAVPNVVYAVDAATPTNSDSNGGYFGGMGYTIMTNDINSVNTMWSEFSDMPKDGALVTWLGYSTNAVSSGGFNSVTDAYGGGASVMSSMLLANSSSGATADMAIRLLGTDTSQWTSAVNAANSQNINQLSLSKILGYINDPSTAVQEVKNNVDTYSGISQNVTQDNALYLVLSNYITNQLSEPEVGTFYSEACNVVGSSINYVAVNVSMLPLYYNDGSYFSTIAYLGSYSTDKYGAATQFFSYNTSSGYATYTNAMYDTFFWKALIGMTPTEAGYSSSTSYLNALALSDGTVKANPGYGLANYEIAYWHVFYNPNSSATSSSSGWVDMDAAAAVAKQASDGGVINYVNGTVMLKYDPSASTGVSGKVTYNASPSTITGAAGIQVSVFEDTSYSSNGANADLGYVKKSTTFTAADGTYEVSVPTDGRSYYVVFSSGSGTSATGSVIQTVWNMKSSSANISIPTTSLSAYVYVNSSSSPPQWYTGNCYMVLQGTASGATYQAQPNTDANNNPTGIFTTFNNVTDPSNIIKNAYLIPDVYNVTVFSPNGTTINTGTVTVTAGTNAGYQISATSGTITVTVTTDVGASAPDGTVITAQDTSSGAKYTGTVTSGKAAISVVPSTYTIYATGAKVSASNPSATVSSNGSSTASLTVFDPRNISVSGAPAGSPVTIMSYGFITSSTSNTFAVPTSGGSSNEMYTAYAVSGNTVYYGTTTGNSISLVSSSGYSVSGVLLDNNGNPLSGTVSFISQNGATFIFTSGTDGTFNVILPAGAYTLYAYGTSSALIEPVTISSNTDLGNVTTLASRTLTQTLNYRTNMSSSSTRGIPFVDVTLTITIDGTDYKITAKTDSSGNAAFIVPKGYSAIATSPEFDTAKFHMDAQTYTFSSGSSNTSYTWTLAASQPSSGTTPLMYVKTVSVSNAVPVTITLYNSSSTKYTGTNLTGVIPGQYNAVIDGSTGYYYSGTVYIYPGQSGSLNIQAVSVVAVTLNVDAGDTITVTPMPIQTPTSTSDDSGGSYYAKSDNTSTSTTLTYYLQSGKSFYFTATSSDNTKIAYATVIKASGQTTLNLTNKAAKATIDGYVGVAADGYIWAAYGNVLIPTAVSSGTFEITVPEGIPTGTTLQFTTYGTSNLTQTVDNTTYTYTGSATMATNDVKDGATIRFYSTTSSVSDSSSNVLSGSGFSFVNGNGKFNLSVKNTGNTDTTYTITAGSSWILDQAYTLKVAAGQTGTIQVSGTYDQTKVGAGDSNLSVTVTSINGTSVGTYTVNLTTTTINNTTVGTTISDANAFPPSTSSDVPNTNQVFVDLAGKTSGASSDAVNDNEYMYAVTLTNNDNYLKVVSIKATMIGGDSNWVMAFSDKAGGLIAPQNPPASGSSAIGNSFVVNGFSSTVIYVKVMCINGSETNVPSISVTVTTTQQGQTLNSYSGASGLGTTTVTFSQMNAQSAVMEAQGMSASGDNVFNSPSPVPLLTMILVILCIIGFIAMVWLGIKKGVLVRRR